MNTALAEFIGVYLLPHASFVAPIIFVALVGTMLWGECRGWRGMVARVLSWTGIASFAYVYWLTADWMCAHWLQGTSFRPVLQFLSGNPPPPFFFNLMPLSHWGVRGELLLLFLCLLFARDTWNLTFPKNWAGSKWLPQYKSKSRETPASRQDSDAPAKRE
jgi:hypothetical protein